MFLLGKYKETCSFDEQKLHTKSAKLNCVEYLIQEEYCCFP